MIERRRGFSLLEVAVVAVVLAAATAFAAGGAVALRRQALTDATVSTLRRLGEALHRYARDVCETNPGADALPPDLGHLVANPTGVTSWRGPYLAERRSSPGPGSAPAMRFEAWDRSIEYLRPGAIPGSPAEDATRARLSSAGRDGVLGTEDDLVYELDVTPELRAETLRRLLTIRRAIEAYNMDHLFGPIVSPTDVEPPAGVGPLPSTWGAARAVLVTRGYLDSDPRYERDAWGEPFVADGLAPLWKVESTRF